MSLTGPVLDNTLTLVLGSTPSTGTTSIEAITDGNLFRIDSFFNIFVQLSLDSDPPLTATRGPIRAELAGAGVPEPSVVALLAAALLGLVGMRVRRRAH
jgi:PEP-CTERM motif